MLAAALLLLSASCGRAPHRTSRPPFNLVILSIDTLRADHLGFNGYGRPTSPTLDRIAAEGVVFEQAITVHVTTAPSHGTILTGLYPATHGIHRNGEGLSPNVHTLAEALHDLGWATGGFVSAWTLHHHTGLNRGFERYDDDLGPLQAGAERPAAATVQKAVAWLETQVAAGRPFFLFLHFFEPHWPYDPPPELVRAFLPGHGPLTTLTQSRQLNHLISVNRLTQAEQREYVARYDAEIVVADRSVETLLRALDRLGVSDGTLLVFLSDHGETLFEREWVMDHGTRPYDEQAHVPLVIRLPGRRLAGRRVKEQVSLVDVVPTVCEVLGVDTLHGLQGRSLMPLAEGRATNGPPRPAFTTARSEPNRLPRLEAFLSRRDLVRAVRLPDVKLIQYPGSRHRWVSELYDLSDDPAERVNLADRRPDTVVRLRHELNRWRKTIGWNKPMTPTDLAPEVKQALRELGYLSD